MSAAHERARPYSDGGFSGHALLAEQTALLSDSTPSDINFLYFLKLRLSAQQRATAQRNYWQRANHDRVSIEATPMAEESPARYTDTASATSAVSPTALDAEYSTAGGVVKGGGGRATSLDETYAFDVSHSAGGVLRQTSRPSYEGPEESGSVAAAGAARRSLSMYSVGGAASAIDDRPAMASGTPQVPAGVDEMKDIALEPCPHCGRTFAPGRLARHITTCERHVDSGAPKAKTDSVHSSRILSGRHKPTTGSVSAAASGTSPTSPAPASRTASTASTSTARRAPDAAAQTEKWRKQSAQVRSAMAGGSVAVADDRVPCPSCGRRFSEDAAARHMPLCKSRSVRLA